MVSLKKNYLYQATYQLLQILVPLITTPYLSRVLGASQIGVFSYTQSIANYFVIFAILGMSTYGVREIAACGKDQKRRSRVFWEMYGSQVLISIPVIILYCFYSLSDPQGGVVIAFAWAMWVFSALLDISWLYFGVEEFKLPTVRSIITKILGVVVIFVFVKSESDLWIYCASISGTFLLNQILLWPFLRRYVSFIVPSLSGIKKHLMPSLRLFIPVVAISFYVSLDKVMLGIMTDMVQAGYFEYSEKLSRMPMAMITAMGTVMLPRMTLELNSGNKANALILLERSILSMLAMAFAMMFGIFAIAHELAPIFLGEEYAECDSLMLVLALIIPIVSTSNVLGRQYLLPTGRDTLFTLSVIVGAVVNILLNVLLIPNYAAMGAAVSTVLAEASVLLFQIFATRKELPLFQYLKNAIPFVVCGLLMTIVVRLSALLFSSCWGVSTPVLVLEVFIGVVTFLLTMVLWCVFSKDSHVVVFLKEISFNCGAKR